MRFRIVVVLVACAVLAPFAVMALRGAAWWRYLVTIVGLNFFTLLLGAQIGQKLIALGEKKSRAFGTITRFLITVGFIIVWLVLWTLVTAPSREVAIERLYKLLSLKVFFGVVAAGVIFALPFPILKEIRPRLR